MPTVYRFRVETYPAFYRLVCITDRTALFGGCEQCAATNANQILISLDTTTFSTPHFQVEVMHKPDCDVLARQLERIERAHGEVPRVHVDIEAEGRRLEP